MIDLLEKISQKIKSSPRDLVAYQDLYVVSKEAMKEDVAVGLNYLRKLSDSIESLMPNLSDVHDMRKLFELHKNTLLAASPHCFHSFLLYLEWLREPQVKFYQPRRRIMRSVVSKLQKLVDGELDELFLHLPPRTGKLLADDTPVLTVYGWKNHGELAVGDYVFSPKGMPVRVIAVHPKHHTTHTVTMTDGSSFDCHFRHEWEVWDRRYSKTRILETQEMIGKLDNSNKHPKGTPGHRYNFEIHTQDPLVTANMTWFVPQKHLPEHDEPRKIEIKSIVENDPKPGNCITVEGGMYLVGEKFIPTHNTSILMFYVTWLVGRDSEKSNLYSAYSDTITTAFYNGCLEIINDPQTYLWHDIFPTAQIVTTNAKEETFNVDRKKRYPSLTCRSLYGTLNGACDCNGVLVSDDLIGGIEEALNKDRLLSAWSKVDNNLIPRAKESAKLLWCGTKWAQIDPMGLRLNLLQNDPAFKNRRWESLNLPALDQNDHSNFVYAFGVGFSDEFYKQRRASFERNNDMASWLAQYQGEPVERSGALFEPDDMKYYNGVLPEEEPVRIFMAIDPAFGGGDYTAAPICYQYQDGSVYVADVVYDAGDKRVTQPLIVSKIKKHKVQAAQFEANKSTVAYKEAIEEMLRADGYRLNITSKAAPNSVAKEIRIRDKSSEIRDFYFIENGKRDKEYSLFMQNVFSFKMIGKNKNDDSVDSLAQAVDMLNSTKRGKIEVFTRTF